MELDAREHIDIELRNLEEKLLKLGRLAVDALSFSGCSKRARCIESKRSYRG